MMRGGFLGAAATLALVGVPLELWLKTEDEDERALLTAIADRAAALVDVLQRNQAIHIANAIAKSQR